MIDKEAKKALDMQLAKGEISAEDYDLRLAKLAESEKEVSLEGRPAFEKVAELLGTGKLEGADLARVVWKKRDLSGARLAAANLAKAKLSKCNFAGADLSGVRLNGADLSGADFTGANLNGVDLTGANLKEAIFDKVQMIQARANEISAVGSSWQSANAAKSSFADADLARVRIADSDFTGVDLTEADLSDAKLNDAKFDGAKMIRASLQNAQMENVGMKQVEATEINVNLSALTNVDLQGAKLARADISNSFLERVKFTQADLSGAIFNVSEHRDVDLTGAELANSSFKSMTGYSEEELNDLSERGAKVDKFYLRRFGRLLARSHMAKIVAAMVILAVIGSTSFYLRNPNNWSYEKLDRQAQEYRNKSDFAKSEWLYKIILQKFNKSAAKVATTRNALGFLLLETKRFEDAEAIFNSVINDFPDQSGAVLLAEIGIADILKAQKKYDEAEKLLLSMTERYSEHPQSVEAWNRLAEIAKIKGDHKRAREIYEKIIGQRALDENSVIRAQFDLAQMFRERREFSEAIKKYREIIERFDEPQAGSRALSAVIQIEVERSNFARAEEVLSELKKQYPDAISSILDGELYLANALLNIRSEQGTGLARLQKILNEHPQTVKAFWAGKSIADYYVRNLQFDEADALYRRLLESFSANLRHRHEIMRKLAELDVKRGNTEQAVKLLETILEEATEPDEVRSSLILYAQVLAANNDVDGARRVFHQLAERFPEDVDAQVAALTGEARILRDARKIKEAVTLLRRILDLTDEIPFRLNAFTEITRIYQGEGNYNAEEEVIDEMLEEFADDTLILPQVKMLLADNQKAQGKVDEALEVLREVARSGEPNREVEALNAMLSIYADRGELARMTEIREEIIKRFPDDMRAKFNARLETAAMLWRNSKVNSAIEEYQAIAEEDRGPFRMQALSALLQIYTAQRNVEQAEKIYKTIVAEFSESREMIDSANLVWATLLRFTNRGEEAVAVYENLITKNQGSLQAIWGLDGLAQYYMETTQYDQAQSTYLRLLQEPALEKNPEEKIKAYNGLGAVNEQMRNYQQALEYYTQAREVATGVDDRFTVEQSIVRVLSEMGQVEQAEQTLAAMRQQYPDRENSLEQTTFLVLSAKFNKNQVDEALAGYQQIADSSQSRENRAAALTHIAQAQVALGRLDEALQTYRKMKKLVGDNEAQRRVAELGTATILRQQRKYSQALDIYRNVFNSSEDQETRYQALSSMAKIYEETGRYEQARKLFNQLLTEFSNHQNAQATAYQGLGNLLSREGKLDEAVEHYRRVLALNAEDTIKVIALNAIAQIYIQHGQYEQARAVFDELGESYGQGSDMAVSARVGEADTLRQNGDYDGALAIYQELSEQVSSVTQKARLQLSIAGVKLAQNKYAEARDIYQATIADQAADLALRMEAEVGLANLLRSEGKLDEAVQTYQEVATQADDENMRQFATNAIAQIRIEQGRLDEAEKVYRDMYEQNSDNISIRIEALMGLGDVQNKRGKYDQALSTYQQVRRLSPDAQHELFALTSIAQTYMNQGEFDRAIEAYKTILEKYPDNRTAKVDALLGIANVLKEKRDYDAALKAYQQIVDEYPRVRQVYWALSGMAQIYSMTGRVDEAARAYQEIETRFPENAQGLADAQLNFANLMRNAGRREEAQKSFQQIIQQHTGTRQAALAMESMAQMQIETQNYDAARKIYKQLLTDFQHNPRVVFNAYLGLGNAYLAQNNMTEAIKAYETAAQQAVNDSDRVQATGSVAQAYINAGKLDEAKTLYEQLVERYPNNPAAIADAQIGLGNIATAQNRPDDARRYFSQVADDFPGQMRASTALQSLAMLEIAEGDYRAMEKIVNKLETQHRDDPNAVINVRMSAANKLNSTGSPREALDQIDRIVERYPNAPQTAWALHLQAQIYVAQKQYDQAEKVFQKIITQFESNMVAVVDAHYGQAELLRQQKKYDEAMKAYQQIVEKWPNYQQAIKALNAIALLYSQRRQIKQEEEIYRRIIENYPNNVVAVLNARVSLANLLMSQKRYDEALKQFQSIYEQHPESDQAPWAKAGAARIYVAIGRQDEAVTLFEELVASYPEDHEVVIGAREFLKQLYENR